MTINKVLLAGRLGADPVVRRFDDGGMVANVRLAVSERYRDKDGQQTEQTSWFDVVVIGRSAEFVEKYVGKGRMVLVDGRLRTRGWEDRDGNKRRTVEVVAMQVQPLERDRDDQGSGSGWSQDMLRNGRNNSRKQQPIPEADPDTELSDDFPF